MLPQDIGKSCAYILGGCTNAATVIGFDGIFVLDGGFSEKNLEQALSENISIVILPTPTIKNLGTTVALLEKVKSLPVMFNTHTKKSAKPGGSGEYVKLIQEANSKLLALPPLRYDFKYQPYTLYNSYTKGILSFYVLAGDAKDSEILTKALASGNEAHVERCAVEHGTIGVLLWRPSQGDDRVVRVLISGTSSITRVQHSLDKAAKYLPFLNSPIVKSKDALKPVPAPFFTRSSLARNGLSTNKPTTSKPTHIRPSIVRPDAAIKTSINSRSLNGNISTHLYAKPRIPFSRKRKSISTNSVQVSTLSKPISRIAKPPTSKRALAPMSTEMKTVDSITRKTESFSKTIGQISKPTISSSRKTGSISNAMGSVSKKNAPHIDKKMDLKQKTIQELRRAAQKFAKPESPAVVAVPTTELACLLNSNDTIVLGDSILSSQNEYENISVLPMKIPVCDENDVSVSVRNYPTKDKTPNVNEVEEKGDLAKLASTLNTLNLGSTMNTLGSSNFPIDDGDNASVFHSNDSPERISKTTDQNQTPYEATPPHDGFYGGSDKFNSVGPIQSEVLHMPTAPGIPTTAKPFKFARPYYFDMVTIPHSEKLSDLVSADGLREFVAKIRSRNMILSSNNISDDHLNAIMSGKQIWCDNVHPCTIIPAHSSPTLTDFFHKNKEHFEAIHLSISSSLQTNTGNAPDDQAAAYETTKIIFQ